MKKDAKQYIKSPLTFAEAQPQMWDPIEGKVLSAEEMLTSKAAMVLSEHGSIRGKFRYFVIFGFRAGTPISKDVLAKACELEWLRDVVEIERYEIKPTHVLLVVLIAPMIAPLEYLAEVLGECKRKGIPLHNGFFIANGKRPSRQEIESYLKDFIRTQETHGR